jgi:phenylpropionate dioxygenase-like ring-hydroxylating dioxygenase large terminal subunit
MLSKEDNELITQTDRGTPMGELFRRFWLPALLAEELPADDCDPVRVRIMGEDLVAFRDTDGNPGVVSAFCAHRGAPMFFARNEDHGIRCIYHGWKYDTTGQCVEMPNIPNSERAAARMRIIAYPAVQAANMIWVYMGPPERKPPLPEFPMFEVAKENVYVTKYEIDCNWLQGLEGDMDPSHVQFLHSTLGDNLDFNYLLNPNMKLSAGAPPKPEFSHTATLACIDTEVGVLFAGARPSEASEMRVNAAQIILPTFPAAGLAGSTEPGIFSMNIRVPIDDEHEMHYRLRWTRRGFTEKELWEYNNGGYVFPHHIPGTYRSELNKDNDYKFDPVLRRQYNYSGILPFPTQDLAMIENQWGPIADRTQEHLMSSDQRIIFTRQRLLTMAKNLANGIEPDEPFKMKDLQNQSQATEPIMVPTDTTRLSDELIERLAANFHTKVKAPITDRGAPVELGDQPEVANPPTAVS